MGIKNDEATLYAAQKAQGFPARWEERSIATGATAYYAGKMFTFHSRLAAVTGGGAAGDTVQFMKLPPGAVIVGGELYVENALCADNEKFDLGVIYEDTDGTNDPNALLNDMDGNDGADNTSGQVAATPTGFTYKIGSLVGLFPYQVLGGWGTVTLTSTEGALVTAKDVALTLYVLMP